jgi:hypothetical protein
MATPEAAEEVAAFLNRAIAHRSTVRRQPARMIIVWTMDAAVNADKVGRHELQGITLTGTVPAGAGTEVPLPPRHPRPTAHARLRRTRAKTARGRAKFKTKGSVRSEARTTPPHGRATGTGPSTEMACRDPEATTVGVCLVLP